MSVPFFSVPPLSLFITCRFPASFCAFLASWTLQSEVCLLNQFTNSSTERAISLSFQCMLQLTVFWKPKSKPHNKYYQKQSPNPSLPWNFSIFSKCNFSTWKSSAKFQDEVSKKWLKTTIITRSYIDNVFSPIIYFEHLLCSFGNILNFGLRWYLFLNAMCLQTEPKYRFPVLGTSAWNVQCGPLIMLVLPQGMQLSSHLNWWVMFVIISVSD